MIVIFRKDILDIFRYYISKYFAQSIAVGAALLVASIVEGVGFIALLPFFSVFLQTGDLQGRPSGGAAVVSDFDTTGSSTNAVMEWVHYAAEPLDIRVTAGSLLVFISICIALKGAVRFVSLRYVGHVIADIGADLRIGVIRSTLGANWRYFTSLSIGELANAMGIEASKAAGSYNMCIQAISSLAQAGIFISLCFIVSWKGALVGISIGILTLGVFAFFISITHGAANKQRELLQSISARLVDNLQGIKPLKAMGIERNITPVFKRDAINLSETYRQIVTARQALLSFQEPVVVILITAGVLAVISVSGNNVPATLVMMVLFYRAAISIGQAQQAYQTLITNVPFFWSIRRRVTEAEAAAEQLREGIVPQLTRALRLEKVTFSYDTRAVLVAVNMEIPVRKVTALTGKSGAGKTTITDLLCGLLEPQDGQIFIDEVPFSKISLMSWRRRIGYVPQEPVMFHDTLLYNVNLSAPDASELDVEWALRAADAWDFSRSLPEGLMTVVGERGVLLSGGQRQRIAIARALVRRPELLILDEATTALDPDTERSICETLRGLSMEMTIFAISHQPAIINLADRAYGMVEGCVERIK